MKIKCDSCNGTGQAYVSCCTQEIVEEDIAMCPVCFEHLGEEDCPDCDGTGETDIVNTSRNKPITLSHATATNGRAARS